MSGDGGGWTAESHHHTTARRYCVHLQVSAPAVAAKLARQISVYRHAKRRDLGAQLTAIMSGQHRWSFSPLRYEYVP